MNNPGYYAIIPADVRYSKIKPNAKLLYGEITALSDKTGSCFATNSYFASLYDVSEKQISVRIKELWENGFILISVDQSAGNKRLIGIHQKVKTYPPKGGEGTHQKVIHSNTVNNTINNNISKDILDTKISSEIISQKSGTNTPLPPSGFDLIWSLYPKKQKKTETKKKYDQVIKNKVVTHERIIEGLHGYLVELKKKKTESQFVKQPTTWLNGGCRDDEYEVVLPKKKSEERKSYVPKDEGPKITDLDPEETKRRLQKIRSGFRTMS